MRCRPILCSLLLVAMAPALAEPDEEGGEQRNLGMSIVGNHEAPKSLVIVPWKSAELGERTDLSRLLDDLARPVDREVFARELGYYRIRTE
jgi:hypothetical protein